MRRHCIFALTGVRHCSLVASTCDAIYRCSYAREQLKEVLFESSVENALHTLSLFRESRSMSPESVCALRGCAHTGERIDLLIKEIVEWFYRSQAPLRSSMTEPWHWYPKARYMRRNFVFHCGPTNSGKTYDALEALIQARSGVYCAPLKALAAQVWRKVNREKPCDLLIGDERQFGGGAEHCSCTMEMTPIDLQVDVGVIDEIQMIDDRERGWAWTRALLALPAREIHLCGETRALSVVKKILYSTFELPRLRVVHHKRLTPLALCEPLNGDLNRVENGDCIVCFSKKSVFDTRERLRRLTGVSPHVVYGALPFAVREVQTDEFNEGVREVNSSGIAHRHILVSTDAIAFGLNMNIRRIIFSTVKKFNGREMVELPPSSILQVGGRAGRFGQEFGNHGFVTTFQEADLPVVRRAFSAEPAAIEKAGILPPAEVLLVYCELLQRRQGKAIKSLAKVLSAFVRETRTSELFFVCDMSKSLLRISSLLDNVAGFDVREKIVFCFVPLSDNSHRSHDLLQQYAADHVLGDVPLRLDSLFVASSGISNLEARLAELEWLYRMCEVYCWLSWRFRKSFRMCDVALSLKGEVASRIHETVARL